MQVEPPWSAKVSDSLNASIVPDEVSVPGLLGPTKKVRFLELPRSEVSIESASAGVLEQLSLNSGRWSVRPEPVAAVA